MLKILDLKKMALKKDTKTLEKKTLEKRIKNKSSEPQNENEGLSYLDFNIKSIKARYIFPFN